MSVDVIVVGARVAALLPECGPCRAASAGCGPGTLPQRHAVHSSDSGAESPGWRGSDCCSRCWRGTPPTPHVRFQAGGAVVEGESPRTRASKMISPRRTVLGALLVDAARAAGAEVHEGCSLVNLVKDRDRVSGVQVQDRGNGRVRTESAALVIGADGKHSKVAQLAGAAERRRVAARTFAFYAYWDGLPVKGGEIYSGTTSAASAWPTNDGLTMTYVAGPIANSRQSAGIRRLT